MTSGAAPRLSFAGTNRPYTEQGFWLSLLYAVLGGMADALGIEAGDINGVIRPVKLGSEIGQEVVIFDDVPGGAGHSLRLQNQDELREVFCSAARRVSTCQCDASASCYRCLKSYRNQFCHDLLVRENSCAVFGRVSRGGNPGAGRRSAISLPR